MNASSAARHDEQPATLPFLLFAAIAMAAGIYARFKGLGFAPVSPDEYYLARGIDGILKYGYPAFDCGGIYQRGMGLQYLIAAIRHTGLGIELSSRIVCAVASLLVFPAAYVIARRITTANVALLAVGLLALSVWQIEIARFGRMYAPFQAVFSWYLVYFLRYTIDRDSRALKGMIGLNLLGVFVWEGSVFLALANFVPPLLSFAESRRLSRQDGLLIVCTLPLLIAGYLLASLGLRYQAGVPAFPEGFDPDSIETFRSALDLVALPHFSIDAGWPWVIAFAPLAFYVIFSLRWAWLKRSQPIAALGLVAMAAGALTHRFALVLAVPIVLLLLKELSLSELRRREAIHFIAALFLCMAFWAVYGIALTDWQAAIAASGSTLKPIASFAYQFFNFPNVLGVTAKPFAKAVPVLSAVLLAGLVVAMCSQVRENTALRTPTRVLLLLMTLVLLGVGVVNPERQETRYVAFLYPLAIVIVATSLTALATRLRLQPATALYIGASGTFLLFVLTEDVDFHHVAAVDSPEVTFRRHLKPETRAHLEIRDDVRTIAEWLRPRSSTSDVIVISGVHGFDYYFDRSRYFFIDRSNATFKEFSCRRGSVDRWTNLPLISSYGELKAKTKGFRKAYLVIFEPTPDEMDELRQMHARVVMVQGLVMLIEWEQQSSIG